MSRLCVRSALSTTRPWWMKISASGRRAGCCVSSRMTTNTKRSMQISFICPLKGLSKAPPDEATPAYGSGSAPCRTVRWTLAKRRRTVLLNFVGPAKKTSEPFRFRHDRHPQSVDICVEHLPVPNGSQGGTCVACQNRELDSESETRAARSMPLGNGAFSTHKFCPYL